MFWCGARRQSAEEPRDGAGCGLDLYCRNYAAVADLQISPFSAAQPTSPPPFCLDAAAQDSKLQPDRYGGLDQPSACGRQLPAAKSVSALIQMEFWSVQGHSRFTVGLGARGRRKWSDAENVVQAWKKNLIESSGNWIFSPFFYLHGFVFFSPENLNERGGQIPSGKVTENSLWINFEWRTVLNIDAHQNCTNKNNVFVKLKLSEGNWQRLSALMRKFRLVKFHLFLFCFVFNLHFKCEAGFSPGSRRKRKHGAAQRDGALFLSAPSLSHQVVKSRCAPPLPLRAVQRSFRRLMYFYAQTASRWRVSHSKKHPKKRNLAIFQNKSISLSE